jgi:hypothetical protein
MAYNPGVQSIGGQLIGQGLASMGQSVGKGITKWQQHKQEFKELLPIVSAQMTTAQTLGLGEAFGLSEGMTPKDVAAELESRSLAELKGMSQMFTHAAQQAMGERKMAQTDRALDMDQARIDAAKDQRELENTRWEETADVRDLEKQYKQGQIDLQKAQLELSALSQKQAEFERANPSFEFNESQGKAYKFAQTGTQASAMINALEETLGFTKPNMWQAIVPTDFQKTFSDNEDYKMLVTAQHAWVEAFVRDGSGAALREDEIPGAAKNYFPGPKDSPKQVAWKKLLREQAENAIWSKTGIPGPAIEKLKADFYADAHQKANSILAPAQVPGLKSDDEYKAMAEGAREKFGIPDKPSTGHPGAANPENLFHSQGYKTKDPRTDLEIRDLIPDTQELMQYGLH